MHPFLKSREYQPSTHQEFWCEHCDGYVVDSQKPESGKFFTVGGHSYSSKTKDYDDMYGHIMFALCSHCLESFESKEI